MTGEEVTIAITELQKEVGSVKHRVDDLEEASKQHLELLLAVRDLAHGVADNTKSIVDQSRKVEEQNKRLATLESKPVKNYRHIVNMLSPILASAIIGYVFAALMK